jgi:hypothetical protein
MANTTVIGLPAASKVSEQTPVPCVMGSARYAFEPAASNRRRGACTGHPAGQYSPQPAASGLSHLRRFLRVNWMAGQPE